MADSQLKMMKRFQNFWSNVSQLRVRIPDTDPDQQEKQLAIIRGVERAHGAERPGQEDPDER